MPQSHTTDHPMAPRGRVKEVKATGHSELNKIKATSSHYPPSEMIAKLEKAESTTKQNRT